MRVSGSVTPSQDELLAELQAISELPVAAAFIDGYLAALEGLFATPGRTRLDLEGRARSFLDTWSELFRVSGEVLADARILRHDGPHGPSEVQFSLEMGEMGGIAWYESGVTVGFDSHHRLRSVRVQATRPLDTDLLWHERDASRAVELFQNATTHEGDDHLVPRPRPVLIPEDWAGRSEGPRVVFDFEVTGEFGPSTILINADAEDGALIPIGIRPSALPGNTPVPSYHLNTHTGCPDFVNFGYPGCLIEEATTGDPASVALGFLRRYPDLYGIGDPDNQLAIVDVCEHPSEPDLGITVTLAQYFVNVPVYGCALRVHLSRSLSVLSISGAYFRDPGVSVIPTLEPAQCFEAAVAASGWEQHVDVPGVSPNPSSATLVVLPSMLTRNGGRRNHLAWLFEILNEGIFVSAHSGKVVLQLSRVAHVTNILDSNQRRAQYVTNTGKVIDIDECYWGATLQMVDGAPVVAEADLDAETRPLAAAVDVVDSFWRRCGRNGWDDRGGDIAAYVDATFVGLNARSNVFGAITFSRGMVAEDIVGHEITHLVISSTSGLEYCDESGAANESYADVFGNIIFGEADSEWPIGEKSAGQTMRYMRTPAAKGDPDHYTLYSDRGLDDDFGGVHHNSGILNRAAVLVSDGRPGAGHLGIGRSRTARLYFETMTRRLGVWSQFIDVLHNTVAVAEYLGAIQMPGVQVDGLVLPVVDRHSPPDVAEVKWAFEQVGLSERWTRGWFRVNGSGTLTQTFYAAPLTGGETVGNVSVMARRADTQRTNNLVTALGPASDTDPSSGITLTMTVPPGVGTAIARTVTTITSPSYVDMFMEATIRRVPGPAAAGGPLPLALAETPLVHHYPTVGGGNKFRDTLFSGVTLPMGCTVDDVELELWGRVKGALVPLQPTHRLGEPGVSSGEFGAYITANGVGTTGLEVTVNSWHGWFIDCRYLLRYYIRGNGCGLPSFPAVVTTVRG